MDAKEECMVCVTEFNKSSHVKIACEHSGGCSYAACKTCVKTYLCSTTSYPNCMNCNKVWTDKFLAQNLGTSFLRTEYAKHRKELLVQQEISRLASSMAAAETRKQILNLEMQIDKFKSIKKEINQNHTKVTCNRVVASGKYRTAVALALTLDSKKELEARFLKQDAIYANEITRLWGLVKEQNENIQRLNHHINVVKTGGTLLGEEKKEARKFVMPCPNTGCRGYLTSQYKCELCEHDTCPKCIELIGKTNTVSVNPHVCKPENVESAEFIRKQSKPCPSCGARISKIDGCDQMWCTAPKCQTAFSWNTGKIVTGIIHNPHYYQFQRENGGGIAARNPGDVVCGGLPFARTILVKLLKTEIHKFDKAIVDNLMSIHRLHVHFTQLTVMPLRTATQGELNNEPERVEYILQKITREELAAKVLRNDNERRKQIAILHVCELFITVGIDLFQKIVLSEKLDQECYEELVTFMREHDALREYCNEQFKEISMLYNVCVPFISEILTIDTTKYNSKGVVDNYIIKREAKRKERADTQALIAEENRQRLLAREKFIAETRLKPATK